MRTGGDERKEKGSVFLCRKSLPRPFCYCWQMIRDDCGQINYGIVAQCNFRTQRLLASWSAGQNWVGLYKKAVVVVMWRLGRGRYKYPELEEVIRSCRCSVMMRMMMMMMIFSTRSLKEWPPLINSHSFMQTLSNQKSRTVSRWLLTGLNLCERMWIIESVYTFGLLTPYCNRLNDGKS